jgi:Fe-S-cluster containining protein
MDEPWYKNGLRFECTRCGNCCGGEPGYVWVDKEEIAALAQRLGLREAEFRRRYTFLVSGRGVSLTETNAHDCIFYDQKQGCTVYEDRPQQCRTWPFWDRVLASPRTWEIEADDCPGMNHGRLHDLVQIRSQAERDGLP